MTSDGYVGDGSPDRVDALVWALSELALTAVSPPPAYGYYGSGGIHVFTENELFHRQMDELNNSLAEQRKK